MQFDNLYMFEFYDFYIIQITNKCIIKKFRIINLKIYINKNIY